MSSLYIENDSSYYLLYVFKHGSLRIDHYDTMKRVNACIKRNKSPPIIYETTNMKSFRNNVWKYIDMYDSLLNTINTGDMLIDTITRRNLTKQQYLLFNSYHIHFSRKYDCPS